MHRWHARSYHIGVAESGAMASTVCSHGIVRTWDLASGERLSEPLKDVMCAIAIASHCLSVREARLSVAKPSPSRLS